MLCCPAIHSAVMLSVLHSSVVMNLMMLSYRNNSDQARAGQSGEVSLSQIKIMGIFYISHLSLSQSEISRDGEYRI